MTSEEANINWMEHTKGYRFYYSHKPEIVHQVYFCIKKYGNKKKALKAAIDYKKYFYKKSGQGPYKEKIIDPIYQRNSHPKLNINNDENPSIVRKLKIIIDFDLKKKQADTQNMWNGIKGIQTNFYKYLPRIRITTPKTKEIKVKHIDFKFFNKKSFIEAYQNAVNYLINENIYSPKYKLRMIQARPTWIHVVDYITRYKEYE